MVSKGLAKKINIFCLLAAIIAVLVFPLKKEIWYDETVSILCSKGISHDTPAQFSNRSTVNSAAMEQLNTAGNVFHATVLDNGNSFLYNILLHWFTLLFGNSIAVYTIFSKLSTIGLFIAFYVLCNLFFEQSIFTSVAILVLATDINTNGMSAEVRAYSMGAFFIVLAAVYFYKFMFQKEKTVHLFLLGLFSVAAVLAHFLSVYIVLVFLGGLLFIKRSALFSVRNLLAILAPVAIIAVFFWFSYPGLQMMSKQNQDIQKAAGVFSLREVLFQSMKFTAISFKAVFPAFSAKNPVVALSFLLVISLYISGIKAAGNTIEKRNLHLLFILGISGSLFLSFLCVKSHHYTALYFRYFSFCIPFCCLYIAYLLSVFFGNAKINSLVKMGIASTIILPAVAIFMLYIYRSNPKIKYNHIAIAKEITTDVVTKIEVPEWRDAFLVHCFLPDSCTIDYLLNPASPYFTLYKANAAEKVLVIRNDS